MTIADRIHITRRIGVPTWQTVLTRVLAIVAALVASGLVMLIMGFNPLEIYAQIVKSSVTSVRKLRETLNKTILLTVLSLGISVAFRMKFWNIGAEGQFYMARSARRSSPSDSRSSTRRSCCR